MRLKYLLWNSGHFVQEGGVQEVQEEWGGADYV